MTIKELAEELQMSTTTVSRVLTNQEKKYRISEKTAKKVREKIDLLRFKPNQIARNLRLQQTNTIGLIIPDISNPFFANLARTVEEELRGRNMIVLLCDTKDETSLEQESVNLLMDRKVDGLLVAPVGKDWKHLPTNASTPVVLIDRYFEEVQIPYVTTDNYQGAFEATNYLIQEGHKQIACVQGLKQTSANQNRLRGYADALKQNQISVNKEFIIGNDYSVENGYHSTLQLLTKEQRPTAIFAINNQIAIGVMKAVNEARLSIPQDLSLVSFDDQNYFELLSPPLSAVQQPMTAIGKKAVELLFDLMEGKTVESAKLLPHLINRSSVKSIENK